MKSKLTLALTILGISAFTVSCGGDKLDNKPTYQTNLTGVVSISGLYAWDNDNGDEGYTVFLEDGLVSDYDYAGDSFDNAGNCYWIDRNTETLTHISRNTFSIENNSNGETFQVTITSTSQGINISGPAGSSNLLNTSLSISDLTPECL